MLNAITWNVDPYVFGDSGIRWYGLLWALGLYICWLMNKWMYKRENCPPEWIDQLFLWIAIGAIIGSRLGHCLFYEWHDGSNPYLTQPWRILAIWEGGLASHGGAIGIIIAAWLLNKKKFSRYPQFKTSWLWILDRLCIGVCVTGALIRFGNLMNSEIYGGQTDLPWGFIFVQDTDVNGAIRHPYPCHPTQIYEIMYLMVALIVTLPLYIKTNARRREGLLLGIFLIIVFATRFGLEFIKNPQEAFEENQLLNMGQILSIPFVLLGIYLIVRAFRKPLSPVVEKQPESLEKKYQKNQSNQNNRKK